MSEHVEVELFFLVNDQGEYVVAGDEETCTERANDDGLSPGTWQIYKLNINAPLPKTIEVSGTLPANGEKEFTLTIA
jgi:hypothetical protein